MPRRVPLQEAQYPAVISAMIRAEMAALAPSPQSMASLYNTVRADSGIGAFPWRSWPTGPKEWIGTRTYQRLRESIGQLENKDWTNGLEVDRKMVRRRGMEIYRPELAMIAMRQQSWKDEMAVRLLPMLGAVNALDGHPFFSDSVTAERGFDNIMTGRGESPENLKADLRDARVAGMRFKWEGYELPLGIRFDTVVCPPELEDNFDLLRGSSASVEANQNAGVINTARKYLGSVIVSELLEDTNDWYYFAGGFPIKPLIYQWEPMENGREVMPETDMTKFVSDGLIGFAFGSSGVVGPGMPFLGMKVTNS